MFSESNLHTYGTSLPLLELDQIPSKKSYHVKDQIATDNEGRRRFHGAFTGGFSAGYWNAVGSKDGWTPTEFKSSRNEKPGERLQQCPEDFMDEEDRSVYGIAPKVLKISEDYTIVEKEASRKRKLLSNKREPLPGEPVLQQFLKPIINKVSIRILRSWGWRPGQGVGPRQTRQEKKKAEKLNKLEIYLKEKYGCDIANKTTHFNTQDVDDGKNDANNDSDDDDFDDMADITFAPEDYDMPPCTTSLNRYGLGYKTLRQNSLSLSTAPEEKVNEHFNLFQPLKSFNKNNRTMLFSGQAFGIGALEDDDDEDVFAKDDLTRYDFSLDSKNNKNKSSSHQSMEHQELILGEFLLNRENIERLPSNKDIKVPADWHPRNWFVKRNRFEPLDPRKARQLEKKFEQMQRATDRKERTKILGESLTAANNKPSLQTMQDMHKDREEKSKVLLEKISSKSDSFVRGGIITEKHLETSIKSDMVESELPSTFKPFANNIPKQKRYDEFLKSKLVVEKDIEELLDQMQPKEMSFWDKRTELKEFIQARKLYQPLKGVMAERFITETEVKKDNVKQKAEFNEQIKFERHTQKWKPEALLCKRYNIPEPFDGAPQQELKAKKTKKLSVFNYLETSVNKKEDFHTPQVITKFDEAAELKTTPQREQITQKSTDKANVNETTLSPLTVASNKPSDKLRKQGFVAKTNLEKQVIENLSKPPKEKKELFKAIFSDDDENEEDVVDQKNASTASNSAALNLLRNNSPPRGIFKALFSLNCTNSKEKTKEPNDNKTLNLNEKVIEEKITFQPKLNDNVYGPILPTGSLKADKSNLVSSNNEIPISMNNRKDNEIWIEKSKLHEIDDDSDACYSDSSSDSEEQVKLKKSKLKKSKKSKKVKKARKHDKKHKKKKRKKQLN